MVINILNNKRIAIFGFGKTGQEVYEALKDDYDDIVIIDDNNDFAISVKEAQRIINDIDIVIKSPGIRPDNELLSNYQGEIVNDIELAYLYILENKLPIKIVGVTGTNGKTTTVTLINDILNANNYKAFSCGNIGISPLKVLLNEDHIDYLVIELSSYQLRKIKYFQADYGLLMNISADHLMYHQTMLDYLTSKLNLLNNLTESKYVTSKNVVDMYYKYQDEITNEYFKDYLEHKDINCGFNSSNIPKENLILLCELINKMNLNNDITKAVINNFQGLNHRLETVNSNYDFTIINDSKATNVNATNVAINSFDKNIVLILGGSHKDEDYTLLDYQNKNLKSIIICGANRLEFKFIENAFFVETLAEAIELALKKINSQEVLLFSPASASFDQFNNYEERGDAFKKMIKESEK